MRSEPIDLVRRWLEAFDERDVSGLPADVRWLQDEERVVAEGSDAG